MPYCDCVCASYIAREIYLNIKRQICSRLDVVAQPTCFLHVEAVHLRGVWLCPQLIHAMALGVSDDATLPTSHLGHCSWAAQLLYQGVQEIGRQRQRIYPLRIPMTKFTMQLQNRACRMVRSL